MTKQDKAKRWRLRFSMRGLLILVTLICAYLACWEPTKSWGVSDVRRHYSVEVHPAFGDEFMREFESKLSLLLNVSPEAPLVVGIDTFEVAPKRQYYFWFFGYVAKLPFEREISK